MFYIIFGTVWTAFTCLIGVVMTCSDGITINDVYIEDPTFADLIPVYLFLAIFLAVGIFILSKGLKIILTNAKTKRLGEERFAVITDIQETGTYINDRAELKAILLVANDFGGTDRYEEILRMKDDYEIGDFVIVQQYKADVNIVSIISETTIPYDKLDTLKKDANIRDCNGNDDDINKEVIIINGKRYIQED